MAKDTSISIRMDSELKMQAESILDQFGLNMTVVVNMLFRQIVREQAVPLSLTLYPKMSVRDELDHALSDLAPKRLEILEDQIKLAFKTF